MCFYFKFIGTAFKSILLLTILRQQDISLVQLIETSSITGHFVDVNGDAYLDIFSCKPFEIELAREVVQGYLNPNKIKITYLTRQA